MHAHTHEYKYMQIKCIHRPNTTTNIIFCVAINMNINEYTNMSKNSKVM